MTDLQQAKKLLEDKISLTKGNIERKKREFARLQKEAEETNNIIVKLNQDLWKDEFALEAVNEEIIKIPTLDYYMKNTLLALVILLTSFTSFAQAHFDIGGGVGRFSDAKSQYSTPVMRLAGGYQFNKVVTEVIIQPSLSRKVNSPCFMGGKVGYNFNGFIPSVGYFFNYCNSDDATNNKWGIGYSLKYTMPVNDNGGVFLDALYSQNTVQLTIGFHVIFSGND